MSAIKEATSTIIAWAEAQVQASGSTDDRQQLESQLAKWFDGSSIAPKRMT